MGTTEYGNFWILRFFILPPFLYLLCDFSKLFFLFFILMRSKPTKCQNCISGKKRPIRTYRYFRCGLHDIAKIVNRQFLTEIPNFFLEYFKTHLDEHLSYHLLKSLHK